MKLEPRFRAHEAIRAQGRRRRSCDIDGRRPFSNGSRQPERCGHSWVVRPL